MVRNHSQIKGVPVLEDVVDSSTSGQYLVPDKAGLMKRASEQDGLRLIVQRTLGKGWTLHAGGQNFVAGNMGECVM